MPHVGLERLGLHRRELRAWAMYDWANSAFQTTSSRRSFRSTTSSVAAAGLDGDTATARSGWATTIALAIIAVVAPLLGALADSAGNKKRLLAWFMGLGAAACAGDGARSAPATGCWHWCSSWRPTSGPRGPHLLRLAAAPHRRAGELDRVSTAGYAIGYLGGGVLLAVNLLWILQPALVRAPRRRGRHPRCPSSASPSGGCASRSRSCATSASRAVTAPVTAIALAARRSRGSATRSTSCALPAGVPDARRLPALQRRHPHDHPHGLPLRRRDRHRPGRADRGARCSCSSSACRSRSSSAAWPAASARSAPSSRRSRSTPPSASSAIQHDDGVRTSSCWPSSSARCRAAARRSAGRSSRA